MRSASKKLKDLIGFGGAVFYQTASIQFTDGRIVNLEKEDFYRTGNSFSQGAGSSDFAIGQVIGKSITLSIINYDDRFSDYDFFGAKITIYCKCDLDDNTTEPFLIGTFTVITPETYGTIIEINATDDIYKTDKDSTLNLSGKYTLGELLRIIANEIQLSIISPVFPNSELEITINETEVTYRTLLSNIATCAGGNIVLDEYNRIRIITWKNVFSKAEQLLDGGHFDVDRPYSTGDTADGGNFTDYSTGDNIDGGSFINNSYHNFYRQRTPKISTDDVIITGFNITSDDTTITVGSDLYALDIELIFKFTDTETFINSLTGLLIGLRFRPYEIEHIAYPFIEFGDLCYVSDRKGNQYISVVTDYNFSYNGFTEIKCSAQNPIRNSSSFSSETAKAVLKSKKLVEQRLSQYDKSVQDLTTLMTQSFGVFKTEEVQEDGSVIYYMHNKPELENSDTRWKITADGLAVSTDSGETWRAGIDSQGNAVVNVLSTVGIKFDWAQGGQLKLGGIDDHFGELIITDEESNILGSWNNTGIRANMGVIGGFKIRRDYMSSGPTTINSAVLGIYLGIDGLNIGGKFKATSDGSISAQSGTIGGFTLGDKCLYSGSSTIGGTGTYLGDNGISVGSIFKVTSSDLEYGDFLKISNSTNTITLGLNSSIKMSGNIIIKGASHGIYFDSSEKISFTTLKTIISGALEIQGDVSLSINKSITVDNTTVNNSGLSVNASATQKANYKADGIEIIGSGTSKVTITHNSLTISSGAVTCNNVYAGSIGTKSTNKNIVLTDTKTTIGLSSSTHYLSFFGQTGATRKKVAKISTTGSADAGTNRTKINDLIDTLAGYGLISLT